MTLNSAPGWEPIRTADGSQSFGATVRDHYVEVYSFADRWGWSMKHPLYCRADGAGGMVETHGGAEAAAIAAAERCRGPRPDAPARRRRR